MLLKKDFVKFIKSKTLEFWKNNPNTFHEMKEGCPITIELLLRKLRKITLLGP